MKVLHLEDFDHSKEQDYAKALSEILSKQKIEYKNIEYLSELLKMNPLNYSFIILDGNFPLNGSSQPDIASFSKALNYLKTRNFRKERIIVWSNSVKVHQMCSSEKLHYFSKKDMAADEYAEKGVDEKVLAKKADAARIANLIIKS